MITHQERLRDLKSGEEFDATYWEFVMDKEGYGSDYYMVTLENRRGNLMVGFFSYEIRAIQALRYNELPVNAELYMSWSLFEMTARRVLNHPDEQVRVGNHGYFTNVGEEVRYTTACGLNYVLTTKELEALLS